MKKLVIYNHGKDSIPWGEKALGLAEVAGHLGFDFISPDYQASNDPEQRLEQLLAMELPSYDRLVLVGSSMGGYVATRAAEILRPQALFLIAPAFYLPGYRCQQFNVSSETVIDVFHGWQDDIVPPANVWRFCREHRAQLHLFDADHRLLSILPEMRDQFAKILAGV